MNVQRLLRLAVLMEHFEERKPQGIERFDMSVWTDECGTAGCAVGTAVMNDKGATVAIYNFQDA